METVYRTLLKKSFFKTSKNIFLKNQNLTSLTLGGQLIRKKSNSIGDKMRLPIGYDDFREVRDHKLDFVDKSLLIKDLIDDVTTKVAVIIRPRRFGKTFNLSMLEHFLAPQVRGKDTKGLFNDLKIWKAGEYYQQLQGKYPVVSITFKDIKESNFDSAHLSFSKLMSRVYFEHQDLLNSSYLNNHQKRIFESILEEKGSEASIKSSLFDLTQYIYLHYQVKPWLLMDEYDTPIQAGYINNYYKQIIDFTRTIFGSALKGNPYLEKAVVTGILRVAKESLFSGVNNLEVFSSLQQEYSEYFGFTESEVTNLLEKTQLINKANEIKDWYNGYRMGNTTIYNPWSIVNCIKKKGETDPYWINTSDNKLIRDILTQSSRDFKAQFESLMQGGTVEKIVDEHTVFGDLARDESAVWSLLLMSGYLKPLNYRKTDQGKFYQLAIPNREIRNLYRQIIEQWLANGHGVEWYNQLLDNLLQGRIEKFKENLKDIMLQTVSSHDIAREPEAFYHGFMLGLTASLFGKYETKSNRESGYGRYDFVIIPKDVSQLGIILEFKKIELPESKKDMVDILAEKLDKAAQEAIEQINQKNYSAEFQQRGIQNIIKIGLAYCGKHFSLKHIQESLKLQPQINSTKGV